MINPDLLEDGIEKPLTGPEQFVEGVAFLETVSLNPALLDDPKIQERLRKVGSSLIDIFPDLDVERVKEFLPISTQESVALHSRLRELRQEGGGLAPELKNTLGLGVFGNLTLDQIGKLQGVTKQAISTRIKSLGVPIAFSARSPVLQGLVPQRSDGLRMVLRTQ